MSALKQLAIKHFRGAVKPFLLDFKPGQTMTVIYGENASGKSTICDALELLGRGSVGSLDNRGLGTTGRYWPTLGRSLSDIAVSLDTADGSCTATITKAGDVEALPREAQPRVEVFRRSQILSLVAAKPAERYAAISRFIDVSGVEASESTLRDLIRDLNKQRDGASIRLSENERTIRQFWETAGSPEPDPFSWAQAECTRSTGDVEAEIAAIRGLHAAHSRILELPARLRSAQQELATARTSAESAAAVVQGQLQTVADDAAEVVTVLQAAGAYLARTPSPSICPVCESPANAGQLASRIRERLTAFSLLQLAQSQMAICTQALQRAEQQNQLIRENARQDVAKFEVSRNDRALPPELPLPETQVPNSATGLASWLAETAGLPGEWKRAETARHERKQFVSTLRQALETWRVNAAALQDLADLLPRLERTLKIVEEERRRFIDDILAEIAAQVSRLYDLVHPDEGVNKIRLELDPKKRASLEIGADIAGQASRPQAYLSESHLDTLGICVFLALSALDQPENTIVVLDDILSSVDDAHANRLLDVLVSESASFRHCIITTHSRLWNEKSKQYQFVKLAPWSRAGGMSLA